MSSASKRVTNERLANKRAQLASFPLLSSIWIILAQQRPHLSFFMTDTFLVTSIFPSSYSLPAFSALPSIENASIMEEMHHGGALLNTSHIWIIFISRCHPYFCHLPQNILGICSIPVRCSSANLRNMRWKKDGIWVLFINSLLRTFLSPSSHLSNSIRHHFLFLDSILVVPVFCPSIAPFSVYPF